MQVSHGRSGLLVAAGIALIVIGAVLNLLASGRESDGYFIVFPFVFGFGNSSILIGLLIAMISLVFFVLFARWASAMPKRLTDPTTMDSIPRVCHSCERTVQADAAYCPYCGTPLEAD